MHLINVPFNLLLCKQLSSVPSRDLCSVAQSRGWAADGGSVPRMSALFFHRLSICERATDHKYIKGCSHLGKKRGQVKCNGPVNFFPGEEVFSSHTCFSRPQWFYRPPPPPRQASFLSLVTPPPPHAPLSQRRGLLRLQGSNRGVLSV